MNPILDEIMRSGYTVLPTGETVRLHGAVGPVSGRVLQDAVEMARPKLACEVGLAFGVSTLYILDAMARFGTGRLIGMDPAQNSGGWRGGGLHNVARAGFSSQYQFHERTSQAVLPELAAAATRIQFAFIDGWHTFDHTLVDFFYIDQMLDIGGIVVLDDIGYPGLHRLAHFIVTNRDYTLVGYDPQPAIRPVRSAAKRLFQRVLAPLVRDDFTPGPSARRRKAKVDRTQLIALRKEADDRRPYNHFVSF